MPRDDLGADVPLPRVARRVVSLVPSLTEALVSAEPDAVVGATDWCTHPPDLDVVRVRGTKNPDLAAVRALAPDVVVANKEENRELDVRRLRESGVAVWVTDIETVPAAVASMERLLAALGWTASAWLAEVRGAWCGPLPPVTPLPGPYRVEVEFDAANCVVMCTGIPDVRQVGTRRVAYELPTMLQAARCFRAVTQLADSAVENRYG